jgi:hypothetical protein
VSNNYIFTTEQRKQESPMMFVPGGACAKKDARFSIDSMRFIMGNQRLRNWKNGNTGDTAPYINKVTRGKERVYMALFLISFIIWSIMHSWTAGAGVKGWFRRQFGPAAYDGLYRLLYNFFSTVTFIPVLYFSWQLLPAGTVWQVSFPAALALLAVQLVGVVGLIISLLQTDVFAFIGVRQALWYLNGAQGQLPPVPFVAGGTYAVVRHPLYLFSLLVLWFSPVR